MIPTPIPTPESESESSFNSDSGVGIAPGLVPSQQCWYSFAAEYTEAYQGLMKLPKLQKQTTPGVGIEPTTLES